MEADRAVNLVEHQKEIHTRPARQWIVSEHRKVTCQDAFLHEWKPYGNTYQYTCTRYSTDIPVPGRAYWGVGSDWLAFPSPLNIPDMA